MAVNYTDKIDLFTLGAAGVIYSNTGLRQDVSKRDKILVVFTASSITSGNGLFTLDGTLDGSYWVTGIGFKDVTTTVSPGIQCSKRLTANGQFGATVEPGWKYIRANVTRTTDGRFTATMSTQG